MKAANLTGWTPDWMDTLYTIYDTISFKLSIIGGMRCDKKDGFLVAPVHVLADIRRIRRPVRQELVVFGSTANWRLVKEEQAAGKNPHRRDSLTPHKTTPPPHQERHKKTRTGTTQKTRTGTDVIPRKVATRGSYGLMRNIYYICAIYIYNIWTRK